MTTLDRIYIILSEHIKLYDTLIKLVGKPSDLEPSKPKQVTPSDEYVAGINLSAYSKQPQISISIYC